MEQVHVQVKVMPSVIRVAQAQAQSKGLTLDNYLSNILSEYFRSGHYGEQESTSIQQLRGSLSQVMSLDMSNDSRANEILNH